MLLHCLGQRIYYIAIVVNYGAGGGVLVGLQSSTTTLTNSQSANVIDEQQYYTWSALFKADIQVRLHMTVLKRRLGATNLKLLSQHVSLVNWSPGLGVDEQQTITVESSCFQTGFCGSTFYLISNNGVDSGPIAADVR